MDQASFTATAGAADQFTSVRLEAQDERGRIASGNVSVQPPLSLTGVEALQPGSEVVGGTSLTLRVELNRIPPAAVSVALSSDDPAVQLPASVEIAGSRRVSVTATTAQVDQQTTVGIDATWDGATAGTTVTLLPPPPLVGLTFTPAEVLGGESSTGTLSIGYPGDEPLEVTLSSSNSAKVQTPGSIVIPAGQTSATFDVTTSSAQAGTVTIEAELGSSQVSEELVVAPLDVRLLELEPSASVAVSGTTLTLTLRVKGQGASGGTVIEVASSHPELLPAPATVTLPQGQSGVTFQVTVQDVEAAQAVTLSATHADTTVETTIMLSP